MRRQEVRADRMHIHWQEAMLRLQGTLAFAHSKSIDHIMQFETEQPST